MKRDVRHAEGHGPDAVRGCLIAGGKSLRMGRDKRFLTLDGQPLLTRMIELLRSVTHGEPIVVGDNLPENELQDVQVLHDAKHDCGPLGGLVAALEEAGEGWVLAVAVDLPKLNGEDLAALLEWDRTDLDVLTLGLENRPEPLAALYRTATAPFWRDRLERGQYGLMAGLRELRVQVIEPPSGAMALHNLNRPEDLE